MTHQSTLTSPTLKNMTRTGLQNQIWSYQTNARPHCWHIQNSCYMLVRTWFPYCFVTLGAATLCPAQQGNPDKRLHCHTEEVIATNQSQSNLLSFPNSTLHKINWRLTMHVCTHGMKEKLTISGITPDTWNSLDTWTQHLVWVNQSEHTLTQYHPSCPQNVNTSRILNGKVSAKQILFLKSDGLSLWPGWQAMNILWGCLWPSPGQWQDSLMTPDWVPSALWQCALSDRLIL